MENLGGFKRVLRELYKLIYGIYGIYVNGGDILQQSNDISDHYLVLCKLNIAKSVNSTPCYKYCRTITSTTKTAL